MEIDQTLVAKILLSSIILIFAVLRLIFFDIVGERMDPVFLLLVTIAILIPLIPWSRLKHIKTSVIELELDQSQVKGAIEGMIVDPKKFGIEGIEGLHKEIEELLKKESPQIKKSKGSRILWIDDRPHNVIGERRLLRALGIEVVTAISSEKAEQVLTEDNDFDLIISDVQRIGDYFEKTGGIEYHDGVNYIVVLRRNEDPVIRSLPVVFYAAYPWDRLVEYTRIARETQPEPKISNSLIDFLGKVIEVLSETRSKPTRVMVKSEKEPTAPAGYDEDVYGVG